ncbi:hypothetical protein GALL_420870 [mine drainage metagenome]|uniref:Uncharacterized protein n=1 Tax=mine drainage metagenome TaxID=410659 RepID=A0A1J5PXM4_9ZZZZ
MTNSSDMSLNRNLKRLAAVITLSAAAVFPGAAAASAQTGAIDLAPSAYAAWGLQGPVTIPLAGSLSDAYSIYGLQGPVTISSPNASPATYMAFGLEGPVENTVEDAKVF